MADIFLSLIFLMFSSPKDIQKVFLISVVQNFTLKIQTTNKVIPTMIHLTLKKKKSTLFL